MGARSSQSRSAGTVFSLSPLLLSRSNPVLLQLFNATAVPVFLAVFFRICSLKDGRTSEHMRERFVPARGWGPGTGHTYRHRHCCRLPGRVEAGGGQCVGMTHGHPCPETRSSGRPACPLWPIRPAACCSPRSGRSTDYSFDLSCMLMTSAFGHSSEFSFLQAVYSLQ